jgi:hypothetical protein
VPENSHINVFREARDQAKGFGEGGAPFEQQARPALRKFIEKRVQCPANPEVFFKVAFVGAKPSRRRDKEVALVFG